MKKKVVIIILAALVLLGGLLTFFYFTKEDKNSSLNVIEKRWIDNNKKVLQDISIYSDVPIFSYNSDGYVFDFLKSLEFTTGLEFNKISYTLGSTVKTEYAFLEKQDYDDKDIIMYTDNFVLVTTGKEIYENPRDIKNITVGVLNNTLDIVNTYLLGSDVTYKTFADYRAMLSSIGKDVDAIVIPRIEYLNSVLDANNLMIAYNIDEYKIYYTLHLGSNNTLNNILTKYYKKWSKDNAEKSFNAHFLNSYFQASKDSSKNIAKLRSKRYKYGFVVNAPYDMLSDNDLVGINNSVISTFAKMSGITIEYKKYDNIEKLVNAFNANEIDFYFNVNGDMEYNLDVYNTVTLVKEDMVILTQNNLDMIVNSVNSLKGYKVGVLKNSKLADFLKHYDIELVLYDNISSLMKDKKIEIKAIDSYNYYYYVSKGIKNYHRSYSTVLSDTYTYAFRNISDNEDFINLFNFYLSYTKTARLVNHGMEDCLNTNSFKISIKYVAVVIAVLSVVGGCAYLVYRIKTKKNKATLSKEDKLKYIDMLTSLKNRNYLNDNIEVWDSKEIYPQTIIIVDLNNIAYINDNYGHAEGDAVIKEAANVLIKTQNPNSEIIRTNGNEFLIYMVSYDEKQVVAYIKKLNKELKELDHGFGAAIGYSIINDAIKTIDDAINEATIDMKNNKEELSKD